jgi:hypothetical protein
MSRKLNQFKQGSFSPLPHAGCSSSMQGKPQPASPSGASQKTKKNRREQERRVLGNLTGERRLTSFSRVLLLSFGIRIIVILGLPFRIEKAIQ